MRESVGAVCIGVDFLIQQAWIRSEAGKAGLLVGSTGQENKSDQANFLELDRRAEKESTTRNLF